MIYRILGAVKIGWIIGTLLASSLCAAERPVPTRPLVPVPETVTLPPPVDPNDSRDAGSQEATSSPADSRPVVFLHTTPGCSACQLLLKQAPKILPEFRIVERPAEGWETFVPTLVFYSPSGQRFRFDWWETADPEKFRERYAARCLPEAPVASAPANLSGQAARYLGPSGTIVVTPAKPVLAVMEDGTRLTYSKLTCQYTVSGSDINLTLSPPLPEAQVRKFGIWFAAQIISGSTVERDGKVTATIKTTKGTYRVDLTEVQP